jgi:hypothetical protein
MGFSSIGGDRRTLRRFPTMYAHDLPVNERPATY